MHAKTHYRAVFVSDLHIGSRGFRAQEFLVFLKSIECRWLYLVGDIFDLEFMRRGRTHWSADTTMVVRRLLKMAATGTSIVYVIGNHDEALQQYVPMKFADNVELVERAVHERPGGRLLIIHGHQFDPIVSQARWLTDVGSILYDWLLAANGVLYRARRALGFHSYWSLSASLKHRAKQAVSFINNFEKAALATAHHGGYSGVITGHIHTPGLYADPSGTIYGNCGDAVESLSCLVEDDSGEISLVRWGNRACSISAEVSSAERME